MAPVWSWARLWAWWAAALVLQASWAAGRGGIRGEPRVTNQWPPRKVVREGDFVKLTCPITANPNPFYEWLKDGEAVKATWNRYNPKKNILRIKNAQTDDAGFFTCVCVNGFGKANASISLIVLGKNEREGALMKPVLTEVWPEGPVNRRQGEELTLTCRARGLPTPVVTWYKNGLLLSQTGDHLTFSSLTPSDSAHYTCRANSDFGGTAANFSLEVGELEISEAVNTTVVEGGSTSLQCTVRTSHQPRVQWLKEISTEESREGARTLNLTRQLEGRLYQLVEGAGAMVARGDGHYLSKLTLTRASPEEAGVYVCLAVNTLGFNFKQAHLTVLRRPGQSYPPVGQKEKSMNWLFLIIPVVVIILVIIAVIVCQLRKSSPDKPVGVSPPTPVLKGDDPSALTPLNQDTHAHPPPPPTLPRPPDLVYQDVTAYSSSGRGVGGGPGGAAGHYDQYPSPYPESYLDPAYSDPYSADRVPTRSSDHGYARLTHPSLASHTSHASSSPQLPPPYAHPHSHTHTHAHTHAHRHPQYFVHYNL